MARNKFPGSQVNLDALCKRYKIDNSKRTKHTALIDCELLSKVYINLIDQKEPTLDLQSDQNVHYEVDSKGVYYFKKVIVPTNSELDLHKKYLDNNLKKTFKIALNDLKSYDIKSLIIIIIVSFLLSLLFLFIIEFDLTIFIK